jgi:hypothetical protein
MRIAYGSGHFRMRRLIALLVVWAGLLGMAAPAIACARAALEGDCCPPGAASCGQQAPQERLETGVSACCVDAAAPSRVAIESFRKTNTDHHDRPAALLVTVEEVVSSASSNPRLRLPEPAAATDDAALTYLLTGRLRL